MWPVKIVLGNPHTAGQRSKQINRITSFLQSRTNKSRCEEKAAGESAAVAETCLCRNALHFIPVPSCDITKSCMLGKMNSPIVNENKIIISKLYWPSIVTGLKKSNIDSQAFFF